MLDKHSPEWRRATDIARTSNPDKDTYRGLDKDDRM
jgi:hypothetical protein